MVRHRGDRWCGSKVRWLIINSQKHTPGVLKTFLYFFLTINPIVNNNNNSIKNGNSIQKDIQISIINFSNKHTAQHKTRENTMKKNPFLFNFLSFVRFWQMGNKAINFSFFQIPRILLVFFSFIFINIFFEKWKIWKMEIYVFGISFFFEHFSSFSL